jgi:hypothetical protein
MACFSTLPAGHCGCWSTEQHCAYAPTSIEQCCQIVCHQCAGKPPKGPDRLPLEAWGRLIESRRTLLTRALETAIGADRTGISVMVRITWEAGE